MKMMPTWFNSALSLRSRLRLFGAAAAAGVVGSLSLASAPVAYASVSYDFTALGFFPGGPPNSSANGINDSGEVVGWAGTAAGPIHAFIYTGGPLNDLGTLAGGSYSSNSYGINHSGTVAGSSVISG